MGIQNDLNVIRNCSRSLLHLTMLTSIVAAAVATASIEPNVTSTPTSSSGSSKTLMEEENIPIIATISPPASTEDDGQLVVKDRPAIPYCDDSNEHTIGRRLLYVTTLDGRLTALDISKGGKLRWSIPTGPGPLISSSIHRLELTNNGQFVRMIPSLSGGIYKFDGESIDPIPITTDNLLSSSAKFSDDLVISGGKETRTYGVSARTGQMLYECSMSGCVNSTDVEINRNATATVDEDDELIVEEEEKDKADNERDEMNGNQYMKEHDPLIDDVIVIRRQTQTVRAVETRTGIERWNFSVGQHELDLIRPVECHERKFSDMEMAILDLDIKVIVPEGVICAFSKMEPSVMLWKYKFDHPIVSAWKISSADQLESIDMFGSAQWLWNRNDNIFEMPLPTVNPSIYVGMYDRQLYIQESINLRKAILDQSNLYTQLTTESRLPKIPWRPIAASSNSLVIYHQQSDEHQRLEGAAGTYNTNEIKGNELVPYDDDNFALSAQSVLNASEYVNGNGYYLYTSDELEGETNGDNICGDDSRTRELPAIEDKKSDNTSTNNHTIEDDLGFSLDDVDAPIKVVILSIWFWWKELAIVAFTSALLLNILISQRNRSERQIVVIERHIPVPTGIEATESSTAALLGPIHPPSHTNGNSKSNGTGHRSISESTSNSGEHFTSRFQSDFDLQRCLGRGGFGVVFEAKNKLDDCSYAIKRITLPNKEESRMRVMREVKTLANCEHQNIVRYFQSWVEKPPPGWQEEEDNKWLATEMSTSIQIDTPSDTHRTFATNHQNGVLKKVEKKKQLQSWMESMASTACSSEHDHRPNDDDDDDDSCIIFRSESVSRAMRHNGNDDDDEDSDSCVIFRSETQSRAIHYSEDDEDDDDDEPKKTNPADAISIDIQSNSSNLSLRKDSHLIDYSQLSDSFQIEFVGSASGDDDQTPIDKKDGGEETSKTSSKSKRKANKKRRPQDLALDISTGEHNNNNNHSRLKSQQNKVYLYIQMQLCRKECLRDWLRDNKTEDRLDFIASIFHQIVDAVDYVHYKGLIHRDLKPSNIFFSQEGQIKIGDFGLVTDMADIPNMITKCGDKTGLPSCARHTQQVGTHLYMSPEQLRGLPYDFKVDIYSLGLIFFELLVYFGTEMERIMTLRALRDGVYPKDFPHNHPKEYELLKKMLSSKPDERPATNELKIQLNEILKLPDLPGDSEAAALAAAARRLSRSRTFSSCE